MLPAKSMKGFLALRVREISNSSRTMRPLGSPVVRAFSSSHSMRSVGSLTVIVLLMDSSVIHPLEDRNPKISCFPDVSLRAMAMKKATARIGWCYFGAGASPRLELFGRLRPLSD